MKISLGIWALENHLEIQENDNLLTLDDICDVKISDRKIFRCPGNSSVTLEYPGKSWHIQHCIMTHKNRANTWKSEDNKTKSQVSHAYIDSRENMLSNANFQSHSWIQTIVH